MNAIVIQEPLSKKALLESALTLSLAEIVSRLNMPAPAIEAQGSPETATDAAPADDTAGADDVPQEAPAPAEAAETPEAQGYTVAGFYNDAAPEAPETPEPVEEPEPETIVTTRDLAVTVDRAAFAAACATVAKAVEKRNTIPILANLLLKAENGVLAIEGTDLDVAVRKTIPCQGIDSFATTAPAHLLHAFAKRAKSADIVLSVPETTTERGTAVKVELGDLRIRSGRAKIELVTLPASDFPDLLPGAFPVAVDMPAETLRDALDAVEFAISTEETRYYLNGVFCQAVRKVHPGGPVTLRMVTTDGHRLARHDLPATLDGKAWAKTGSRNWMRGHIVPRQTVTLALALLPKPPKAKKGEPEPAPAIAKMEFNRTKVRISCGDLTITSKLIDGTYPVYARVIPQNNDKALTVDADAMREAIDLVTVVTSERGRAVKLGMVDGRLTFSVNNPDSGSASEVIAADYSSDAMEIGFNSGYLVDILDKLAPGKRKAGERRLVTFRMSDPGGPVLIEGDAGPLCVLMPMRV